MNNNNRLVIVDSDLSAADHIITQLDEAIQHCGNLELSRQLNEISECYESIRMLISSGYNSSEAN